MGEGANSKPIYLGRYIVFYAILLYYVAFCSVSTIHFVVPFTVRLFHIFWLIFVDKRWNLLAIFLCLAAFVRYIFFKRSNKEIEDDLLDLPFQSSSMAFELPPSPPLSPPSSFRSPPSSPPSSFTSTPSFPHTHFTCSSSSLSSPRSAFSSPPPQWKSNYVRMSSNVSLSSEDSGDSDIDTKAEKFIAEFRSLLKFENKPCDPNN